MSYFKHFPDIFYQSPLETKISSGDLVQIKNILEAAEISYQESGEWPSDVETLENDGYLGIKTSTKRKWQFDISETEITATSLGEMKGGEGKIISLIRETGDFIGYGEKNQ